MDFIFEIAMTVPRPVMALLLTLLLPGFIALCIMNKNLRLKLRALRRELAAALKGRPKSRRSRKSNKPATKASEIMEAKAPLRPT